MNLGEKPLSGGLQADDEASVSPTGHAERNRSEAAGWTRRAAASRDAANLFRSRVESVGAHLPERRVTSEEIAALCTQAGNIDLQGATGIVERRMASGEEDSLTLALSAARDCLAHSRYVPEDLDLLVFCGITKYHGGVETYRYEPSLSRFVADSLGARNAISFNLGNACAGMMTGVHVVDDFVRRGIARCGMVVSGEFISHLAMNATRAVDSGRHLQAASLTLGDAGAAVIIDRTEGAGIEASVFTTLAEHVDLCIAKPSPDSAGAVMFTHAREINEQGVVGGTFIIERGLAHSGLALDDIEHVITHQTAVPVIEAGSAYVTACLGGTRPHWVVNVDRCGNTASTSHFLALRRCLAEGRLHPGERVLLSVQASGLVVGAVIVTLDEMVERYQHAN